MLHEAQANDQAQRNRSPPSDRKSAGQTERTVQQRSLEIHLGLLIIETEREFRSSPDPSFAARTQQPSELFRRRTPVMCQPAVLPPSAERSRPVTKDALAAVRNTAALAISSGWAS